jgi:hypothetical protein
MYGRTRPLLHFNAEVYSAAMRLIEQHGDAAELAAILRGDPLAQRDEQMRQAIIDAIEHLRRLERPN